MEFLQKILIFGHETCIKARKVVDERWMRGYNHGKILQRGAMKNGLQKVI